MNNLKITSKLPGLSYSIFAVMSKLANENQAINLSQGFPDFDVAPKLIELVNEAMKKGHNQYAPMPGVLALRMELSQKVEKLYGHCYDPADEITITAGGTEALYASITALTKEGDEVIIFEPAYDSYAPAVRFSKGHPVFIKLKFPDYSIDWEEVRKRISPKTRLILLNSPNNPTGSVISKEDIHKLQECTKNTDIIIISDEVYEHIIFDGETHHSLCSYPDLLKRSVIIGSFGKSFHATGWKIGYCLAPREVTEEIRKLHQFITFAVNTPIQYAISEYMKEGSLFSELGPFYQNKRDYFVSLIKKSRFKILPCRGTYFLLLDYSAFSDEKDFNFAVRLTKEFGVASVPVSSFYDSKEDNKVLRFCFAKKNETLQSAAERICRI